MKTATKSIFRIITLCLLMAAIFACASSGGSTKERGLEVENIDVTVYPQLGHSDKVSAIAYSPDGKHIVSGSYDKTIKIWDAESGREIRTLSGHTTAVSCVAYSPDGKFIASGSCSISGVHREQNGTIKVWDADNGKELLSFGGDRLDYKELTSLRKYDKVDQGADINAVTFSPDGTRIAVATSNISIDSKLEFHHKEVVRIYDAMTGALLKTYIGQEGDYNTLSYSPDGKRIVAGGKHVALLDANSGREIKTTYIGADAKVRSVSFTPDGKQIAVVSTWDRYDNNKKKFIYTGDIFIYNAENLERIQKLTGETESWKAEAKYSPDGKYLMICGFQGKVIEVLNAENYKLVKRINAENVKTVQYSPDGTRIAAIIDDTAIKVWDAGSGQEMVVVSGNSSKLTNVVYSSDGKLIASINLADGEISVFDAASGQLLRKIKEYKANVLSFMFSRDLKRIVCCYGTSALVGDSYKDVTSKIWDVESGKLIATLKGLDSTIRYRFMFSPDGTHLVSDEIGNENNNIRNIRIWDAQTGKELWTYTYKKAVFVRPILLYSPDGTRLACLFEEGKYYEDKYSIKIFDVENGKEILSFSFKDSKNFNRELIYSPDSKRLMLVGNRNNKIWDAQTGEELRSIRGPNEYIRNLFSSVRNSSSAVWSSDGLYVLVAGIYKLWIYDTEKGRLVRTVVFGGINREYGTDSVLSPDGKRIAFFQFGKIKLYNAETGRYIKTISEQREIWNHGISIEFSPDSKYLLTGPEDGTVRVWDAATGDGIACFANFSGSDTQLALASRGLTVETQTAATSNEGEWLTITPDGFYQASPRGDRYINVRVNNTVSGIDAYRSVLYNPDVVQARLQGKPDPASKSNVTIQQAATFTPPEVTIQSPVNFSTTNTTTTNLSVNITSKNQPIKNIKIIVNGRLIGKDELVAVKGANLEAQKASLTVTGNQKTVNLSLPLELDPGNNRIEVVAFNGYSENRRYIDVTRNAPAGEKPALPNLWIVAVGVNAYDNAGAKLQGMNSLNYAVADAKGLVDSLKAQEGKRYGKVNVMLIADGEAQAPTTENIRQGLKFFEGADPRRDVVILFLAGHGISAQESKFFFLPKDAVFKGDRIVDATKAISGDEIMTVLDAPGNRLVFIDACQSGGVDNDRMVRSLMDTNAFVFTASRGSEPSFEDPKLGHGYFTYSVMSALKGAPAALAQGSVSVLSMSGYVKDDVPKKTGGRQNPSAYSLGFYDFPVAEIK